MKKILTIIFSVVTAFLLSIPVLCAPSFDDETINKAAQWYVHNLAEDYSEQGLAYTKKFGLCDINKDGFPELITDSCSALTMDDWLVDNWTFATPYYDAATNDYCMLYSWNGTTEYFHYNCEGSSAISLSDTGAPKGNEIPLPYANDETNRSKMADYIRAYLGMEVSGEEETKVKEDAADVKYDLEYNGNGTGRLIYYSEGNFTLKNDCELIVDLSAILSDELYDKDGNIKLTINSPSGGTEEFIINKENPVFTYIVKAGTVFEENVGYPCDLSFEVFPVEGSTSDKKKEKTKYSDVADSETVEGMTTGTVKEEEVKETTLTKADNNVKSSASVVEATEKEESDNKDRQVARSVIIALITAVVGGAIAVVVSGNFPYVWLCILSIVAGRKFVKIKGIWKTNENAYVSVKMIDYSELPVSDYEYKLDVLDKIRAVLNFSHNVTLFPYGTQIMFEYKSGGEAKTLKSDSKKLVYDLEQTLKEADSCVELIIFNVKYKVEERFWFLK